ncbi:hypothetical protein HYALB_00006971 [Hymenoscyphus albidus]|uniref:2EXR domain-containing protein n=1 Tax=Hymenoscyphus albidus TaxID=595503 RepID=A0A9N9LE64_9HELO|nr:hypothetical protein HYALB_00006971 [Hymenoscyphus albidus]
MKLPVELRTQIWKYFMTPSRIILHRRDQGCGLSRMYPEKQTTWEWFVVDDEKEIAGYKVSLLCREICREAAMIISPDSTLISYTRAKHPRFHRNGFFFSFAKDILFTACIEQPVADIERSFFSKIQNVGAVMDGSKFRISGKRLNPGRFGVFLREMKSLRTIYLVYFREFLGASDTRERDRKNVQDRWEKQKDFIPDWKPLNLEIVRSFELKPGDRLYGIHDSSLSRSTLRDSDSEEESE